MSDFQIDIEISSQDTATLAAAHSKVTLIYGRYNPTEDSTTPIWLEFAPFEKNTVNWQDTFGVFASPEPLQETGTAYNALSSVFPAKGDMKYVFKENIFALPEPLEQSGAVTIENDTDAALTMGLLLGGTANGARTAPTPASARSVAPNMTLSETLQQTVSIFVRTEVETKLMTTVATGPVLTLEMRSDKPRKLKYAGENKGFVVVS